MTITVVGVSVKLLEILGYIARLSIVVVLGPTYDLKLFHTWAAVIRYLPPTTCFIPLLLVATLSVLTYTHSLKHLHHLYFLLTKNLKLEIPEDYRIEFENGTYPMFRELRDIVKHELVWVSQSVKVLLTVVGDDTADDLGLGVLELRMSSELLSLLLVWELICTH